MSKLDKNKPLGTVTELQASMTNVAGEDAEERLICTIRERQNPELDAKLHPLLAKRRREAHIPDGAFKMHAVYDRVLLWQPFLERETVGDTKIILSARGKSREREEAPRGIIVSAGLGALDQIRSHGMDLGHYVNFIRLAPWRLPVDTVYGKELHLLVLRAGDLIASEDLMRALNDGTCTIRWNEETGQHQYVDASGMPWQPSADVFIPQDY